VTNVLLQLHRLAARGDRGQTMAEYSVVLAVITLAVVGALIAFSTQVTSAIGTVGSSL
jgi:Flp pilus assembly pilin Flp